MRVCVLLLFDRDPRLFRDVNIGACYNVVKYFGAISLRARKRCACIYELDILMARTYKKFKC